MTSATSTPVQQLSTLDSYLKTHIERSLKEKVSDVDDILWYEGFDACSVWVLKLIERYDNTSPRS